MLDLSCGENVAKNKKSECEKQLGLESKNDDKLFVLCKRYSKFIRYGRQKFIGLLPEVFKSRMYQRKGFVSIYEFAAKLAYMSRDQVDLVLNLNRRFEDKPVLQLLLLNGEASLNKLARVASIATKENQEILAEQVKLLPQKALETLVRDEKLAVKAEDRNGLQWPTFDDKSLRAQTLLGKLKIDAELVEKIYELQEKGIDINEMIREMLERRDENLEEKKNEVAREAGLAETKGRESAEKMCAKDTKPANSRYISVKVRRILREEYGNKCSIAGCKRPAEQLHHTQRFALAKTHDPRFLAPLCSEHHKIAHAIDIRVQKFRGAG
jgi:hypothetical protein